MTVAEGEALGLDGPLVVTGATGFVGGALLRRLAAMQTGPRLRALVRPGGETRLPPGVEPLAGDLGDRRSLAAALRGAAAVVHAAAALEERGAAAMSSVNAEGTRLLVDAAIEAGIERFVLLSSAAVYGGGVPGAIRDEESPLDGRGAYAASKLAAEREAWRFAAVAGARLTVLRPSGLYGPGRRLYSELLAQLGRRPFRVTLPGDRWVQPGHVDDLAAAIVAALADREAGARVFNVAGPETLPLEELHARLARFAGLPWRRIVLPRPLARLAVELRRWRGGVAPDAIPVLRAQARGEMVGGSLDSRRIERRYRLVWTPLDAGLREMVASFAARGRE